MIICFLTFFVVFTSQSCPKLPSGGGQGKRRYPHACAQKQTTRSAIQYELMYAALVSLDSTIVEPQLLDGVVDAAFLL